LLYQRSSKTFKDVKMDSATVEILRSRYPLLDKIQVAFLLTDVHSKILYANRKTERLFGYEKEEIEEQRLRVLFLEEDLIYFLPNIIYLTVYQEGFEGEALLRQKDGTKIFVHLFTTAFKEEGETFLAFSFQEIQHLKRLERDRLESERWASLGRMVEEIAHQIRNPIVSIVGFTKRILKYVQPSNRCEFYLEQILKETRRLETIIKRVEDYVHLPRPSYQREKIQEVVESALQGFSREAAEKEVPINLETGKLGGDGSLFIDKGLVINSLSHLLRNSVDALAHVPSGKKGKTLHVLLFEEGEHLGISVIDKGEGIPKKNLDRVFEPFFSSRPDHVGLGLTFVKRVMEEHGGRIRVESHLRRGTKITLVFPKDRRRKVRREFLSPEAKDRSPS